MRPSHTNRGPWWPLVVMLAVAISGILIAYKVAVQIDRATEERWQERGEREALVTTGQIDRTLGQTGALLRSLATLFYASEDISPQEFAIAGDLVFARDIEYSFACLFYAPRVTYADKAAWEAEAGLRIQPLSADRQELGLMLEYFPVDMLSCPRSSFARGSDLASTPAMKAAVSSAYRMHGTAVMGPAFFMADRWWALFAIAAPDGERNGVLAGLIDLSELFANVLRNVSPGLELRLLQHVDEPTVGMRRHAILGSETPIEGARATFQYNFAHGLARWQVFWDLLPGYAGGIEADGAWAFLGGSLGSLIVALLIGSLLMQNAEVRRRVRERTAELAHARDEAERANRSKTEFLATVSHELRTPLNAIIGFSEILRKEMIGPIGQAHYRDYANDIHVSGTHLLDLINDILDVAKAEAGAVELQEEPADLARLALSCLRLLEERAQAQGLRLTRSLPDDLPPLMIDTRRVRQVVLNLLSNALKFTPAGGTVDLSIRRQDNGSVALHVRDSGIGMRPDDIPKALTPFRQLESALHRKYEGSGIGLPLCKRLVELHGGELVIDSQLGAGTTVSVIFPPERVGGAAPQPVTQAV